MDQKTQRLFKDDQTMQQLGATLVSSSTKNAAVALTVNPTHTQGHGTCHGAVIFAIADAAFAMACNSGEQPAVGQHCNISYLKPGQIGDTLTATAEFRSQSGRSEIYDVTVTNQLQQVIAEFRGISRFITPTTLT